MAKKRGGGWNRADLENTMAMARSAAIDLLAINEALEKLESIDPMLVRIIELRFFSGLTERESAEVLGISESKARKDWAWARAWLRRELEERS
jgi:DNA-directed RNA polymerase specialized sigma24 family protein